MEALASPAIMFAVIGIAGLACQWLAWSLRLPAILFLLLTGLLLGPGLGWLNPDALLGELLFPLISLCVAIILFEGSLTLKVEELKETGKVVRRLVTLGMLVTGIIVACAARWLTDLSWSLSLLFGSLVVVTGPTVIVPLLRTVRPVGRVADILRWEGIVIDPLGALLAVLVYEFIIADSMGGAFAHTLFAFVKTILLGGALGIGCGLCIGQVLRRNWLPDYLHNLATVSTVFAAFAFSNWMQHESGLLAVTAMGFCLANMRGVHIEEILSFKENLTILFISGLFILLAARLDLATLLALGWSAVALLVAVQFVARPVAVFLSTLGSGLNWRERTLIAWIGPRGIVAAAVSGLFALRMEQAGYANSELLVSLTFVVIIGTVVLQSATSRRLARLLQVADPSPRGFLLIGADHVARAVGVALTENEFPVVICDSNWEQVRAARMEGLPTFHGNPVSDYAEHHLQLTGIGFMLGMKPQREHNVIAAIRYKPEFGGQNIFSLQTASEAKSTEKHAISQQHKGYYLSGSDLTYNKFSSLLNRGAKISTTRLSEAFGYEELLKEREGKFFPLFAIDKKERIHVFTDNYRFTPEAEWRVIGLDYMDVEEGGKPV
jgi:NhaP-type Na+/H+ or K+/H+ antiporter